MVRDRLLADPVSERAFDGAAETPGAVTIEVHPQPGVMDPAAASVRDAIRALTGVDVEVSTGSRFDFHGVDPDKAAAFAEATLANPVIHQISRGPYRPKSLPRGTLRDFSLRHVRLRGLSDAELTTLSRDGHLFLSLEEMRAVKAEFERLGREPTDIELETIAQTWSEHCVHKTLKSTIRYSGTLEGDPIDWSADRPGHIVDELPGGANVTISNLLKSTSRATHELIAEGCDWALSVFKDNSGVVALDDEWGVNIKVETHNRPSAIEPYGGAATGIGGCIRDVIGTGLGAKPIAATDVFCVAHPDNFSDGRTAARPLPPGTLHPQRILSEVVAGVRDYGNRMGIPTVGGGVFFDDRYVGNPLVFCGCIGLLPRNRIFGGAKPGDRIIALGGRTGRDGIHGATFSSAELGANASTEFAHAVQIGNAIEEKRLLDAILRARDFKATPDQKEPTPLFHAITDCGAGGFSSAVGEMGSSLGALVNLEQAPLKYDGLSYTEVWISEAQERMILAVPQSNIVHLKSICDEEGVPFADLGVFGTDNAELVLRYRGTEVGRLPMTFLHDGIPMPTRTAVWNPPERTVDSPPLSGSHPPSVGHTLHRLMGHPTIASKHLIIRQYDHEVQGNTVVKPLVGPGGRGPGDGAVIEPISGSGRGIAISCGLQLGVGDPRIEGSDPYQMALAGIDEAVRNAVCVGANPRRIAILDNFCWPGCDKPENLAMLVRACEGCYDGAKAYGTPFVSGKDSLNNQLRYTDPATGEKRVIEIPPTLLITALGIVPNVSRCVTMDAKSAGNSIMLIGGVERSMGGSLYEQVVGLRTPGGALDADDPYYAIPRVNLAVCPRTAQAVAQLIADGLIKAAHDCSEGGVLVALTEMLIASGGARTPGSDSLSFDSTRSALSNLLERGSVRPGLGAELSWWDDNMEPEQLAFSEGSGRYLIEVAPGDVAKVRTVLADHGAIPSIVIGKVTPTGRLLWQRADLDETVESLADRWLGAVRV